MKITVSTQPIVTNGLIVNFDVSNPKSYSGTGTQIRNIVDNTSFGTMAAGVSLVTNPTSLRSSGSSDSYIDFTAVSLTNTATIEMLVRLTSTGSGMFIGWDQYDVWYNNGGGSFGFNTANSDVYGITITNLSTLLAGSEWGHYIFEMRSDVSYTNNKIFINGKGVDLTQQISTENSSNRTFNSGVGRFPGWRNGTSNNKQCDINLVRVYNRSLTKAEIEQNFNSIRNRIFNDSTDLDAQAFILAAEITDVNIIRAINELVKNGKRSGWWYKCVAIYPFVGGTAFTHKFNLKNPLDTNAVFRLTFTGGFTHSSTGVKGNGSNAWAETYCNPSTHIDAGVVSLSIYSRSAVTSNRMAFAAGTGNRLYFYHRWNSSDNMLFDCYGTTGTGFRASSAAGLNGQGFLMATRTSSTDSRFYKNGVQTGSTQVNSMTNTPNSTSTIQMWRQDNGTLWNDAEFAFASIGNGMGPIMVENMNDDIQLFQSKLNRKI